MCAWSWSCFHIHGTNPDLLHRLRRGTTQPDHPNHWLKVPRKYWTQGLEIKAQTKPGISLLARVLEDPTLSTTPKISSKELLAEVVVMFWQMEVICGILLWPCLSWMLVLPMLTLLEVMNVEYGNATYLRMLVVLKFYCHLFFILPSILRIDYHFHA